MTREGKGAIIRVNVYLERWPMKITIKEIAALANCSTATVSKVVNGKDQKISLATRQRVMAIIDENSYIPNRIASSMVTKMTHSIGLIIPDITNPFFPEVARGVEDYANKVGYHLILCNSDNQPKKERAYIGMLQEKMVDGIIFTSSCLNEENFNQMNSLQIPVIAVDREIKDKKFQGKITVDNFSGAYEAVSYMITCGYKRILHISGPMTSTPAQNRYSGYRKALTDYSIAFDPRLVIEGNYKSESGYEATVEALKLPVPFDGVFCGNDMIALGAIRALQEARIKIPEDVGVVGFDDIYLATVVSPRLTTVRQPNYQMGYKAAEMLISLIHNPKSTISDVVLKTELVVRESTK